MSVLDEPLEYNGQISRGAKKCLTAAVTQSVQLYSSSTADQERSHTAAYWSSRWHAPMWAVMHVSLSVHWTVWLPASRERWTYLGWSALYLKPQSFWSLWRNKKVGWTSSGKKAVNKEHLASCSHFLCRRLWDRKRRTNEMYKSRGVKLVQGSLRLSQKQLLFKVTWERPASLHSSSTRINIFSDRYLNNLKNDFFFPPFFSFSSYH